MSVAARLTRASVREKLYASRTYYVRTDGSNSNNGLVNSAGGAFLTIQAAVDAYQALDLNGYTVTISVADGTYTGGIIVREDAAGATSALPLQIVGNAGTPASCIISPTSADCLKVENGAQCYINGFKLQTTTSGRAIKATNNGYAVFGTAIDFGVCATYHLEATIGGNIVSSGGYAISGGSGAHIHCTSNGHVLLQAGTVTISNTPAFSAYFVGVNGAYVQTGTVVFSGSATGKRFLVHDNGTIYTGQTFSQTYFPGNSAGEVYGSGVVDDVLGSFFVFAASAVAVALTGTTNETVLATITIPANTLGANGIIRLHTLWSNNNNANTKTFRARLNGLGTQAVLGVSNTTGVSYADQRVIHNVNATNSQKGWQFTSVGGLGQSSGALTTAAIDTSAAITLVLTGQLANSADNLSLEGYVVEVCYRP